MTAATKTRKPKKAAKPDQADTNDTLAEALPEPKPAEFSVIDVPIGSIDFVKGNRDGVAKGPLEELAASMKARGLLNDILLRRHPDKKDAYELVAGERRVRAAKLLKWDVIWAKVFDYDLPLADIRAIGLVENLQRQDLSPFEEATHLAGLRELHPNLPIEELAHRVGRGPQWVAQRLAIGKLIPELRKLVEEQAWPLSHLPILARVPAEGQAEVMKIILAEQENDWDCHWSDLNPDSGHQRGAEHRTPRAPSLRILEETLADLQRTLANAPWKLDDAELVPAAGPCTTCPKRSGAEALLFPELDAAKDDRCLDAACWRKKEAALVALGVEKLKAQEVQPILITGERDFRYGEDDDNTELVERLGEEAVAAIKPNHSFEKCKKTDPKAQPAVIATGPKAGTVEYVKPHSWSSNGQAKKERAIDQDTGKPKPPSSKERLKTLEQKRQCRAVELWIERLEKPMGTKRDQLVKLLIVFGTHNKSPHRDKKHWQHFADKRNHTDEAAWEQLFPIFQDRLNRFGPMDKQAQGLWDEAQAQAEALDEVQAWEQCWTDAVTGIKLPKTLASAGVEDPAAV